MFALLFFLKKKVVLARYIIFKLKEKSHESSKLKLEI